MTDADRVFATPAGVILGPIDQIPVDTARNYVLQLRAGRFHGFVVRKGDGVYGYVDRCPHMGLPLPQELDGYLTDSADLIVCSWHSALFEIETGLCVGGPCVGARLEAWPVKIDGDTITTA